MKRIFSISIFFSLFFVSIGHAQIFPYIESFDSYTVNQPLNGDGGLAASSHVYVAPYGVVGNCAEFQMSDTAMSKTDTITSPVIGRITANTATSFYFRAVTIVGGVPTVYQMTASDSAVIYVGTPTLNIILPQYRISNSDQNTTSGYVKVTVGVPSFLSGLSGRFRIIAYNPAGNNWKLEFDSLVVRDTLPIPPILTDSVTNVACRGGSTGGIKVFATGATAPYTYRWSVGGDTTDAISGQPAGIYTVTVTDHLGATASLTDTIRQPALSLILDSLSQRSVRCYGAHTGYAIIYASGGSTPYNYVWNTNPPILTDSATDLAAGNYNVTVTDAYGCALTATTHISQPSTPISLTGNGTQSSTDNNGTATVVVNGGTGPFSYLWSTVPPDTTSRITGLAPGLYEVTVTDGTGCHYYDTVFVAFPNGISEVGGSSISLYPNPASGQIDISTNSPVSIQSMTITDVSGRIVIAVEGPTNTINISSLTDGMYILRLNTDKGLFMKRLIIRR